MNTTLLKQIGLSEQEIHVYLALLKKGRCTVKQIAEVVKYHRTNIYDTLEKLIDKGFVSYIVEGKTTYYRSTNPEFLRNYMEDKLKQVDELIPELSALTTSPKETTRIEVIRGKNAVRFVLKDVLKTVHKNDEVCIFGVDEKKFIGVVDEFTIRRHMLLLREKKISERLLAREGETVFLSGPQSRYRVIPEKFFNPNPIYVYGNKAVIIIWGNPDHVLFIENKALADSYRKQFNLLWKIAKKVNKEKVMRKVRVRT